MSEVAQCVHILATVVHQFYEPSRARGAAAPRHRSCSLQASSVGGENVYEAVDDHGNGRKRRILVVEDNIDNRRILVYRLRRLGDFEILEATNGQEAVLEVENGALDLIFMDLKMPVMDGWEATRRIRALKWGRRVPIIALTAQAMAGDEQKALAAGCDDYVAKPIVDQDVVRRKLERLLDGQPSLNN